MIAYLDSSAMLKGYLTDERGVLDLHAIVTRATRIATSRLTYVEVRAGLAAARRANRMGSVDHDQAAASFEHEWAAYLIIELSDTVGSRAGSIADSLGLRASDAVQLASAIELGPTDTLMVAWDARLRMAARATGVVIFPVEI